MISGMVFCRGCGKEIHSTAPACPMCGAPQGVPIAAATERSIQSQKVDYASRSDIPDSWKRIFEMIEKAGGSKLPNIRELQSGERMRVMFNWLAFFFGPIYYLIKGLWQQAVSYFAISIVVIVLLEVMGFEALSRYVGIGFSAVYATRANVSYYKKVVLGESSWF